MKTFRITLVVGCVAFITLRALAADNDAVKADMARLQGEWSLVSGIADGNAMPDAMASQLKRVCKDDETTVTMGEQMFMKAKFTLDPSKNPKTIDYEMTDGFTKGKKQQGIYEINGDTVKFCFGSPDGKRPTKFASEQGDGQTLSEWKRAADDWKPENGFITLYNGKDLTGWCYDENDKFDGKTEASDGRYSAKGDTIVVNPHDMAKGPRLRQMWTTQKFPDDFVLKLEFRAAVNADSGVFLRKPQLQCRDYLVAGPYKKLTKYKPQDWNTLVVTVHGNEAHCECNGEVLEDAIKLPETGPIGLEADRGQMEYRHIQITKPK
jgi:uncharacterized protein (TIGR03067 family)